MADNPQQFNYDFLPCRVSQNCSAFLQSIPSVHEPCMKSHTRCVFWREQIFLKAQSSSHVPGMCIWHCSQTSWSSQFPACPCTVTAAAPSSHQRASPSVKDQQKTASESLRSLSRNRDSKDEPWISAGSSALRQPHLLCIGADAADEEGLSPAQGLQQLVQWSLKWNSHKSFSSGIGIWMLIWCLTACLRNQIVSALMAAQNPNRFSHIAQHIPAFGIQLFSREFQAGIEHALTVALDLYTRMISRELTHFTA